MCSLDAGILEHCWDCLQDLVKKSLLQHGIQLEDFGGDVQAIPISALKVCTSIERKYRFGHTVYMCTSNNRKHSASLTVLKH